MASQPVFSRLALAAALLEYDNDPDDPYRENVNHKHSAIFIGLRNKRPAPALPPLQISQQQQQRPDSRAYNEEGDEQEQWRPPTSPLSPQDQENDSERPRSMDVGAMRKVPHARTVSFSALSRQSDRPHSVHLEHMEGADDESVYEDRRSSDNYQAALRESERVQRLSESVADGGSIRGRSSIAGVSIRDDWGASERPIMVPMSDSEGRPGSISSRLSLISPAVGYSKEEREEEILRNPFEIPAPPGEIGSRWDPKTTENQRRSIDLSQVEERTLRRSSLVYDDMPSDPRESVYSEGGRRPSLDTMGNRLSMLHNDDRGDENDRVFDEIPEASEYGRALRPPKYTNQVYRARRQQLLRPKTLHMPSMLEGTEVNTISVNVPHGFTMGSKPLPTDARASILNMGVGVPLSLSQRTFRSSLMVGGERDDPNLFRGTADEGEELYEHGEDPDQGPPSRKPGKLYGTSLIDQLEARKDMLHNKRRTFYGDNRPSMMARTEPVANRQTIMLEHGQQPNDLAPPQGSLGQRPLTSYHSVPQLNLPDEEESEQRRLAKSRSVFGVDTVWEKEMAKLKAMEEADQQIKEEAEARKKAKELLKAEKAANRKSLWGGARKSKMIQPEDLNFEDQMSIVDGPKSMADIEAENEQRQSMGDSGEREDHAEDHIPDRPPTVMYEPGEGPRLSYEPEPKPPTPERRPASSLGVGKWFAESGSEGEDSEDDAPLRNIRGKAKETDSGNHSPIGPPETKRVSTIKAVNAPVLPAMAFGGHDDDDDDSSDEEPLSRVKAKVAQDDSDEEVPLSQLRGAKGANNTGTIRAVGGSKPTAPSLPNLNTNLDGSLDLRLPDIITSPISAPAATGAVDDDDDEPLFLRKARNRATIHSGEKSAGSGGVQSPEEVEDDLPLAWKHASAAQKQQNIKVEAQMRSQSMMMPSMYGQPYMSTYGMPTMAPAMGMMSMAGGMGPMGGGMPMGGGGMPMVPPGMPFPPYDAPDPGSNIDNWRKEVAGGGGTPAVSSHGH